MLLSCGGLGCGQRSNSGGRPPPIRFAPGAGKQSFPSDPVRQRLADAGAKIGRYRHLSADDSRHESYTLVVFEQRSVIGSQLTDVAAIPDVEIIQLKGCQVETGAIGALRAVQRPIQLVFDQCELPSDSLSELDSLTSIVYLSIIDTPINDKMLSQLHELPKLSVFYLRGGDVSDVGLAFLAQCPLLRDLSLVDLSLDDEQVSQIVDAHDLHALNLRSARITDRALKKIATLSHLTQLRLSGCSKITDATLVNIAELSGLKSLDLSHTAITNDGLRDLAKLGSLEELGLGYTSVTDDGLKNLSGLHLKFVGNQGTQITGVALRSVFGDRITYTIEPH